MKQLLLVGMIHLLILHQYNKDKKEPLANQIHAATDEKILLPHFRSRHVTLHRYDSMIHAAYINRTVASTSYHYLWIVER